MRDCLERGEVPIASHLLYPQVLDDAEPGQRQLGIDAGLGWVLSRDFVAFHEDRRSPPRMRAAPSSSTLLVPGAVVCLSLWGD